MRFGELQQRLGITTIVVTHDQREAMTMADVVVVMNGGQVEQIVFVFHGGLLGRGG